MSALGGFGRLVFGLVVFAVVALGVEMVAAMGLAAVTLATPIPMGMVDGVATGLALVAAAIAAGKVVA